ncbi:tRNA (adenosine(37)-N6)-threonylcarbamoyltransferase complex dimerization subunit type 1 TsaB [Lactobacillus sp. PV037]|uniref:tRNA (adenosine(37)-N6)-threonylcarbamoyltransferase complex dimerization subunit type 1 TsaB n=1 Tax=unclassified Lactobacillus TaxID=2620435 RepID=UPI00223F099F|nr:MULTISPECIES: tRNA (adenosine(37)-N6)-threonylcarbamoyltransferase complex dimerization subunit type 1 TsaB [unclassified Lactobacillus]QNQ81890.1 tRNA (adenosine(37)-N6)-threonylcarbamoyltransferase complex dimerization subunit type 1 TsaB [Lactobacillus sp. PV012]QNQ84072.1 tRNA (adenosine(37)-N6)-threonylcarbamoyltransferase complex dimerization subunit type 1 TsaB [Lactobacillus sp. PV037]
MKILSITTATNHLSVALVVDGKLIAEKNEEDNRNHSEHLDPLISELLKENNLSLKDIDRFAVAQGPGSYTGLRIGITTAKMFATILNKELVGVSTLAALANGIDEENVIIVPEIDARNNNFFAGAYLKSGGTLKNVVPDGHYSLEDLIKQLKKLKLTKKVIFVGSNIETYLDKIMQVWKEIEPVQLAGDLNQVHAAQVGFLGQTASLVDPDKMIPKYLRRTQAEMQWHEKTGQDYGLDSDYVEEV